MKKLLFFSVATFLFMVIQAQETQFGIKAGVNLASVEVEDGPDYDARTGVHLGGLAHIHLSRYFAIQPEIYYSMQGGERNNTKLKLNYINVPVLLQFMIQNGFRLQTGPQLGILTSAKSKTGDIEIDLDDEYSGIDFSWSIGAGYLFPAGIGIDLRYNHGLINVWENENEADVRNRSFQIGLFYQFMQGKTKTRK